MLKWVLRVLLVVGVVYNLYVLQINIESENLNSKLEKEVLFINCGRTNGRYIHVEYLGKLKRVEIPREICKSLAAGDRITLIYDKPLKSYHFPGDRSAKKIATIFGVMFLFSFANHKKLQAKIDSKIADVLAMDIWKGKN